MKYVGKLFGQIGRTRGYFDTGKTSGDWDALEARAERAEAELKRYTDAVNAQPWATDEPIRVLLDRVTMLWASEKQSKIERGDMLCGCQDQLRAERDWLKTWQDQAETNYVIGEPLAKKLRDTEAERDELRGALALGQQNCDDAYDDLRAERDQLRAEVELWEAKCHELIAPHYIIDPCLRAAKFREALAFHPVIRKSKKEDAK